MALGVLNNISAIYAQNNLSNTQASLSKTLQQLSSGSRINSGADDAAGLSLANGLQASSTALTQSAENASEGVDFLQVADGALSQVTSLLNRAVTLATEASNGTLNSAQVTAADSEYQKILTETDTINNNTEYNGINTFAKNAALTVGSANDKIDLDTGVDTTAANVGKGTATIAYGNLTLNIEGSDRRDCEHNRRSYCIFSWNVQDVRVRHDYEPRVDNQQLPRRECRVGPREPARIERWRDMDNGKRQYQ